MKKGEKNDKNKVLARVMVLACDGWRRGSHGLSARRAWRTKSSRPEGPKAGPKGRQLEVLNITCFLPTLFSIMLLLPLVATHFYTFMLSVSFPRNLEIKMCVFDFMFDVFYQLVQIRVVPVFQSYLIKYPSRQIGLSPIKRIALNIWQFNLAFHMKCGRQEGRCTLSRPEKNAQQPFTDSTASSHFYPGIPGLRSSMGRVSLSTTPCADLTDVTLADEYTNSILTDIGDRAFQGNVALWVTQPGGQL